MSDSMKKKEQLKQIKLYNRKLTEVFYVLVRRVTKVFIMKSFKPIIIGVENIPKDKKSIFFVSNHRDNFDPVIATLAIERPVHWMALLRLFEARENLFGSDEHAISRRLSSIFIKLMGSVPVTREKDNDYDRRINIRSVNILDDYLKANSAVGVFPEATLNRKPEEQNILPVKSNRIFKLAVNNKSWMLPLSIVWVPRELGIENKVIFKISKPIDTAARDYNELAELWKQIVNENIDEIKKLFNDLNEINLNYSDYDTKIKNKTKIMQKYVN